MTLQEAMELGRSMSFEPRSTMVGANTSISDLPCHEITRLFLQHGYTGELPDLSLFPNLTSFSSSIPISMEYLARQDLTRIKKLSLAFENGAGAICILAPALEELSINIRNNGDPQMDMFTCAQNSIYLTNMPHLRELRLQRCTWHEIIIHEAMPSVEKVVFCNQDYTDYSVLQKFPNLKELTVTGCGCCNVDFVKGLCHLRKVDVCYNYISDISPLLELPLLEEVNLRRNTESNNAHLLQEKGIKVIRNDTDYSFERFKADLRLALWRACQYVDSYRFPIHKGSPEQQYLLHSKDVAEVFTLHFGRSVRNELEAHSPNSKRPPCFPVPRELLVSYVQTEYPFIQIESMLQ